MPNISHSQNGFGTSKIDWIVFPYAGIPDGTVGVGYANKGSVCVDVTNVNMYLNAGTKAAPVWKLVTRAA